MSHSQFQILYDRAFFKISGSDRGSFLQKLITNDVTKKNFYSYFLNNHGRYLNDFFVYDVDDSFIIDISNQKSREFNDKLALYKLRAQIKIENVSHLYQIIYSHNILEIPTVMTIQDFRSNLLGLRNMVLFENIPISYQSNTCNIYTIDKYCHTIPDGEIDLIYERSIPIEYGGIELNAIDMNKGCYLGQEVIARAKYHGVIRKQLYKILSQNNFDQVKFGTEIIDIVNNQIIGKFCSSYQNLGIAIVNKEKIKNVENLFLLNDREVMLQTPSWQTSTD